MSGFLAIVSKIFLILPTAVQTAEKVAGLLALAKRRVRTRPRPSVKSFRAPYIGSEVMTGHYIDDQAGFDAAITQLINGSVAVMNSVKTKPPGS